MRKAGPPVSSLKLLAALTYALAASVSLLHAGTPRMRTFSAVLEEGYELRMEHDLGAISHEEALKRTRAAASVLAGSLRRASVLHPELFRRLKELKDGPIYVIVTRRFSPRAEADEALPSRRYMRIEADDPRLWKRGRLNALDDLVCEEAARIVVHSMLRTAGGNPFKRLVTRKLYPAWLICALPLLYSREYTCTPDLAMLLETLRSEGAHPRLGSLEFIRGMSRRERRKALCYAVVFLEWLEDECGEGIGWKLLEAFTEHPYSFARSFRRICGMTLREAEDEFEKKMAGLPTPSFPCMSMEKRETPPRAFRGGESPPGLRGRGETLLTIAPARKHMHQHPSVWVCRRGNEEVLVADDVPEDACDVLDDGTVLFATEHSYEGLPNRTTIRSRAAPSPSSYILPSLTHPGSLLAIERLLRERDAPVLFRLDGARALRISPKGTHMAVVVCTIHSTELRLMRRRTPGAAGGGALPDAWKDEAGLELPPWCCALEWLDEETLAIAEQVNDTLVVRTLSPLAAGEKSRPLLSLQGRLVYLVRVEGNDGMLYMEVGRNDRPQRNRFLLAASGGETRIFFLGVDSSAAGRPFVTTRRSSTQAGAPRLELEIRRYVLTPAGMKLEIGSISLPPVSAWQPRRRMQADSFLERGVGAARRLAELEIGKEDAEAEQIEPGWSKPGFKLVLHSDIVTGIHVMKDELGQRFVTTALWYDSDYERFNFEIEYEDKRRHPGWYAAVYNCTNDDFLELFPLKRYSGGSFTRGMSVGKKFFISPRTTLTVSIDRKETIFTARDFEEYAPPPAGLEPAPAANSIRVEWHNDSRKGDPYAEVDITAQHRLTLGWECSSSLLGADLRYQKYLLEWERIIPLESEGSLLGGMKFTGGVLDRKTPQYPMYFELGGPSTLPGVTEDALRGEKFFSTRMELIAPVTGKWKRSVPAFLGRWLYLGRSNVSLYATAGTAYTDSFSWKEVEKSIGVELASYSSLTRFRTLVVRTGFAHGLDAHGENSFYVITSSLF